MLLCMMCGEGREFREEDEQGQLWCYCKPCDCWTEHPPTVKFSGALIFSKFDGVDNLMRVGRRGGGGRVGEHSTDEQVRARI